MNETSSETDDSRAVDSEATGAKAARLETEGSGVGSSALAASGPARIAADEMSAAAEAFLATLDAGQLDDAVRPFSYETETDRTTWFYTPTDHGGLPLSAMSPRQQAMAFQLLASGLSEAAYVTVSTIMSLENVLDRKGGHVAKYGFERGRDSTRYYMRVFGQPGDADWGWRFGGHHVSVNHSIVDYQLSSSTPSFFGANPASAPLLGPHPLRPLGGLLDSAVELMADLNRQQLTQAIVSPVPPIDVVGGNRTSINLSDGDVGIEPMSLTEIWRGRLDKPLHDRLAQSQRSLEASVGLTAEHRRAVRLTRTPVGLGATEMTAKQRQALKSLLSQYIGRLPDEVAELEVAKVSGERFNGLHLAWAGSIQPGKPMYYRIQGQRLVVEFDNTANDANHIHSVWRDPLADFGGDALAHHYATSH